MPALQQRATVVTQTLYKPGPTQTVQQPQQGSGIPIGAIVGGTLAGIVLTLVVTIGWKFWGWRLMQPVTKKPAHLRIPEKGASRPSSMYSRYSTRIGADWKTKTLPVPTSPAKMQKCLLLATPVQQPGGGRFPPTHTLFAIQEEGGSTRCSTPHGKGPRAPSPVVCADLGKSSLAFPKTGAPQQQEQPRHVKYVSAVYDNSSSLSHASHEKRPSMDRTSKASSVYSTESMGQVHHLSYLQHQQPAARY
ncbi:hypothetical protein AURDEDRAFT_134141 [Auricularia subglabra TFB-10046 SS5]|nr:hypothetical protein AURDEDRAFT_134141 [Auricularia subglabra TFB-10046 SS5]